jgi:hypothetical protein
MHWQALNFKISVLNKAGSEMALPFVLLGDRAIPLSASPFCLLTILPVLLLSF